MCARVKCWWCRDKKKCRQRLVRIYYILGWERNEMQERVGCPGSYCCFGAGSGRAIFLSGGGLGGLLAQIG